MATVALILLIAALVLFLIDGLATFKGSYGLQSLGLACLTGSFILTGVPL